MLLRVTNGTTTVILNDNSGSPTTPLAGAVYFPRDPGSQMYVTETARVGFAGSVATLRTVANNLERLFAEASDRNAPDVYVEYRPTDSGDVYRSPLTSDSRVVWPEEKGARQMATTTSGGEFAAIFVRANYWEGPEAELASGTIKNGTTSPYNILALSDPGGTMPCPLSLEVINATGGAISPIDFYFNVDAYVGMTTNQHLLTTPTSVGTGGGTVYLFSVSATVLAKWAGRDAQLILALSTAFTGYIYAAAYTTISGVYQEVYRGSERYISGRKLINLGSIPLPPGAQANTSFAVAAGVYGASTLSTSFLQIAPAENALNLHQIGYATADGTGVFEDGIERRAWAGTVGTRYEIVRRSGGPLLAYPGRSNRLHMLFDEGSNFTATRDMTVTVNARPRRATI